MVENESTKGVIVCSLLSGRKRFDVEIKVLAEVIYVNFALDEELPFHMRRPNSVFLIVEFITHFTNDFFKNVFHGRDTANAPIFVENDGKMLTLAAHVLK